MKLDYRDCGIIGFTCSAFDLLHAGHITMLEEAKRHCDYLIVGLQINPNVDRNEKNQPVQSVLERQIQLAAVKYVDEVVVYATETELEDVLHTLPINIRFLGEEYKDKKFTGRDICDKKEIKLHFNNRSHSFSSTSLRQRVYNSESNRRKNLPEY